MSVSDPRRWRAPHATRPPHTLCRWYGGVVSCLIVDWAAPVCGPSQPVVLVRQVFVSKHRVLGRRDVRVRASRRFVTSPSVEHTTPPNRTIDDRRLGPIGLAAFRRLPKPVPFRGGLHQEASRCATRCRPRSQNANKPWPPTVAQPWAGHLLSDQGRVAQAERWGDQTHKEPSGGGA